MRLESEKNVSDAPLCVDMDGTLILQDLLMFGIFRLAIKRPQALFFLSFSLLKGRAKFKDDAAEKLSINPSGLTFNRALVEYLISQKKLGRRIILVTGNNAKIAQPVARYLGLFSEVIASTKEKNLVGRAKANQLIDRFGLNRFDYIGNSYTDIPVWRAARNALIVSENQTLIRKLKKLKSVERIFGWRPIEIHGFRGAPFW